MDKKNMSKLFKVSLKTLYNWEKNKPELMKIINKGIYIEEYIREIKKILEKIEKLK